jgi:protein gp37/ParB-like chromosome segregation protein Spo0J
MDISKVAIGSICQSPKFTKLFRLGPVELIVESMEKQGFDDTFPIVVGTGSWLEEIETNAGELLSPIDGVVVDGNSRLAAAKKLGMEFVPIIEKPFESLDEAISYSIQCQLFRRNLSDAEIFTLEVVLDELKQKGRPRSESKNQPSSHELTDSSQIDAIVVTKPSVKSSSETAAKLGTNRGKVEQVRYIRQYADLDAQKLVATGKSTINKVYNKTFALRKAEALKSENVEKSMKNNSTFNVTTEKIEWAKWTWNPIVGCLHGCPFCYARDIAMRYYGTFEPTFREERLQAPHNTRIPKDQIDELGIKNVFVCSMADLFGDWVLEEQIQKILDACRETPQWTYIFLTKNPKRYSEFSFPDNSWVGATVDTQDRMESTYQGLMKCDAKVRFISCEPLKGPIELPEDIPIDWVIIGGQSGSTGEPAGQPEWEWVENLTKQARKLGVKVYWKPNLTVRPKEYPEIV